MIIKECPLPQELVDIPLTDCPFKFDQIVRMAFAQRQSGSPFTDDTAITLKSNWDALIGANDDTKIVWSPLFAGFVIPKSEVQSSGGNDNTTIKGIRRIFGNASVTATGDFSNMNPLTLAAMDHYTQYSLANSAGLSKLTAYFFNKDGYGYYVDGTNGITIYNFIVGSRGTEGLNADDLNGFSLDLQPDWDRTLKSFKPADFDPLTDY